MLAAPATERREGAGRSPLPCVEGRSCPDPYWQALEPAPHSTPTISAPQRDRLIGVERAYRRLEPAEARAFRVWAGCRGHAGVPVPALDPDEIEEEARDWASWADPAELRVYLAACFVALPAAERRLALDALGRRVAA